jgi:hypothetical protein
MTVGVSSVMTHQVDLIVAGLLGAQLAGDDHWHGVLQRGAGLGVRNAPQAPASSLGPQQTVDGCRADVLQLLIGRVGFLQLVVLEQKGQHLRHKRRETLATHLVKAVPQVQKHASHLLIVEARALCRSALITTTHHQLHCGAVGGAN